MIVPEGQRTSYCHASFLAELNQGVGQKRRLKSAKTLHIKWEYVSHKPVLVGGLSLGTRFGIDRLNQLKAVAVIYILFLYCTVILVTAAHRGFTPEQFYLFFIMPVYTWKFNSIFISA